MRKVVAFLLFLSFLANCTQYIPPVVTKKLEEKETSDETDIFQQASRYCKKKRISEEHFISLVHSFIPAVNSWEDLRKINPHSWGEVTAKVDQLLAKEEMRLFVVFGLWFVGWNIAYLLWRFGVPD